MSSSKLLLLLLLGVNVAACSGNGGTAHAVSPVSPSPATGTPAPGPDVTMKGTVSDTAFHELAGATIEILNGSSAGLTTVSDANGQWGFAGTFDDTTQFRATKDGYDSATLTLGPFCERCHPNRWVNFVLKVLARPVDVAGSYSLTIKANPACSAFPEALRTRTYAVTLPPLSNPSDGSPAGNAYFAVSPTGANFVPGRNQFEGGVSGNYLGFWFEVLAEEVAPSTFLTFNMSAGGKVDTDHPETIEIQSDGAMSYCTVDAASGVLEDCFRGKATVATCNSPRLTLVLTLR